MLGGEVPPIGGVAGLHDDRASLRGARHIEERVDVEEATVEAHRRDTCAVEEDAGLGIRHDRVVLPRCPQPLGDLGELGRPRVPVGVVEVAAAAEVRAVEGVGAGHRVPAGATAGQVVERRELTGELVRLVERRRERADETDVLGDPGERREDRERVGAPEHVEVVHLPAVLAQPQTLGQEDVVEQPALGVAGEVLERGEVDLAARGRVGPHGLVVHTGEVGGEVDLALRCRPAHAETSCRV